MSTFKFGIMSIVSYFLLVLVTDHAVRMARFAREVLFRTHDLVKNLETSLGPGTADLTLRVGLHSGPVTAGVLRGEKSRFQLFGDTVTTASRMESTGEKNKIQVSLATADLIRAADKESWLTPRQDLVSAKGNDKLQTYWVKTRSGVSGMSGSSHHMLGSGHQIHDLGSDHSVQNGSEHMLLFVDESGNLPALNVNGDPISRLSIRSEESAKSFGSANDMEASEKLPHTTAPHWTAKMLKDSQTTYADEKSKRLIEWHLDLLSRLLKQIAARRVGSLPEEKALVQSIVWKGSGRLVVDEVVNFISFPKFDPHVASIQSNFESVDLGPLVMAQLRDFLFKISSMYRDNPFHNFEHASHVTMSANKLLNRIVRPIIRSETEHQDDSETLEFASRITSDPLTHFAVVLSALIHDVDHTGVSNSDLIRAKAEIAQIYNNKSVAEQNSVDVAWELLMDPSYEDLQRCIYQTQEELDRFRQIVVNMVIATDIFDEDAKAARQKRWNLAFKPEISELSSEEVQNLKATVLLEYVVQASDVGHAMQHWQIFRKWNELLFQEIASAHDSGRAPTDPYGGWFEAETSFFDFYVIPLARKLLESGAFGVSSDEYINYAIQNRSEWIAKGPVIVADMCSKYKQEKASVNC